MFGVMNNVPTRRIRPQKIFRIGNLPGTEKTPIKIVLTPFSCFDSVTAVTSLTLRMRIGEGAWKH
jgi:hypothetical protein